MAKTVRQNDELKTLAAAAKMRLSKGYWTDLKEERSAAIRQAKEKGKDPQAIVKYYSEKCVREIAAMSNSIDRREEEMYAKVKEALDSNTEVLNPIAFLMDRDYMQTLTDTEKQRYVLSLMGKYAELKERYLREKEFLRRFRA